MPGPGRQRADWSWFVDINIFLARANTMYDVLAGKNQTAAGQALVDNFLQRRQSWSPLRNFTVRGRSNWRLDSLIPLPCLSALRDATDRWLSPVNEQRLALAVLLHEMDHGQQEPDGDWREALRPYLDDDLDLSEFENPFWRSEVWLREFLRDDG